MSTESAQAAGPPPPPAVPASLGDRLKAIFSIAIPVALASSSQTVVNLFDSAMVGRLGEVALASVGQGGYIAILCVAPFIGLASAVQAMAARRVGQERTNEAANPLNAGLLVAFLLGGLLSIPLYLAAPHIMGFVNNDPEVIAESSVYLRLRILALVPMAMGLAFRGYWNGVSMAKLFLATQIFTHVSNIVISWILIFGYFGLPAMGVEGAGLGTAISIWMGALVYLALAFRFARVNGFARALPSRETLTTLLKQMVPTSMEQSFAYVSISVLFFIVARIGTAEVAAMTVLMNMVALTMIPQMGMGVAGNTFVSRNLGAGRPEEAQRWGWDVAKIAAGALAIGGLPMIFVPDLLLWVFLSEAPEALEVARLPLQMLGAAAAIDSVGWALMHSLLGAGAVGTVLRYSIVLQICSWIGCTIAGPVLGLGLAAVWGVHVCNRVLLATAYAVAWHQGKWKGIEV